MAGHSRYTQSDMEPEVSSSLPAARLAGLVASVEGTTITLTAPHAAQPETPYLGEPNPRGTVGEFLLVKSRGFTLLARLTRVELSQRDMHRADWHPGSPPPDTPIGEAQLLATVQPDGALRPGVEAMPRIGDSVFSADSDLLKAGIGSIGGGVSLGHLSQNKKVPVELNMEALLGRHLAVLGTLAGGRVGQLPISQRRCAALADVCSFSMRVASTRLWAPMLSTWWRAAREHPCRCTR